MKKSLLSILFTLGSIVTPILLTGTLSNNFNVILNQDILLNTNKNQNINQSLIFTKEMADTLVAQKENDFGLNWEGNLNSDDFDEITSIAPNAFRFNTKIISVRLPYSVKTIGTNAFASATNLTYIQALGAIDIGDNAFPWMNLEESIPKYKVLLTFSNELVPANIDKNVKLIALLSQWGIENYSFVKFHQPKINVEKIVDNNFIKNLIRYKKLDLDISPWNGTLFESDFYNAISIAPAVFKDNTEIISVRLPDSIKTIGADAFSGCTNLTHIWAFGARSIRTNAFFNTPAINGKGTNKIILSITDTITDEQLPILMKNWGLTTNQINANIVSLFEPPLAPTIAADQVISSLFVSKLINFKEITSSTTWDGILTANDFENARTIEPGAFFDQKSIISIALPTTVITIGDNAFSGVSNLTAVSAFGATTIKPDAFLNTNLEVKSLNLTYSNELFDSWKTWGMNPDPTNWKKIKWTNPPTIKPSVTSKIITSDFLINLVRYKEFYSNGNGWNGIINSSDLINATSISTAAFDITGAPNNALKNKILEVNLPDTFVSLEPNAFSGTLRLKKLTALSVHTIDNNAFASALGLIEAGGEINLTFSLKKIVDLNITGLINDEIVTNNTTLNRLIASWGVIPQNVTNTKFSLLPTNGIVDSTFVNLLIFKKSIETAFWDNTLVTTDFIGATTIADNAFTVIPYLLNSKTVTIITSISLPTTVKTIGDNAFSGASALTTLTAYGITSIGTNAFKGLLNIRDDGIKLTSSANISIDKAESWGTTANKLDIFNIPPVTTEDIDQNNLIIIIALSSAAVLLIGLAITGFIYYHRKLNSNGISDNSSGIKNKSRDLKENKTTKPKDDEASKPNNKKESPL